MNLFDAILKNLAKNGEKTPFQTLKSIQKEDIGFDDFLVKELKNELFTRPVKKAAAFDTIYRPAPSALGAQKIDREVKEDILTKHSYVDTRIFVNRTKTSLPSFFPNKSNIEIPKAVGPKRGVTLFQQPLVFSDPKPQKMEFLDKDISKIQLPKAAADPQRKANEKGFKRDASKKARAHIAKIAGKIEGNMEPAKGAVKKKNRGFVKEIAPTLLAAKKDILHPAVYKKIEKRHKLLIKKIILNPDKKSIKTEKIYPEKIYPHQGLAQPKRDFFAPYDKNMSQRFEMDKQKKRYKTASFDISNHPFPNRQHIFEYIDKPVLKTNNISYRIDSYKKEGYTEGANPGQRSYRQADIYKKIVSKKSQNVKLPSQSGLSFDTENKDILQPAFSLYDNKPATDIYKTPPAYAYPPVTNSSKTPANRGKIRPVGRDGILKTKEKAIDWEIKKSDKVKKDLFEPKSDTKEPRYPDLLAQKSDGGGGFGEEFYTHTQSEGQTSKEAGYYTDEREERFFEKELVKEHRFVTIDMDKAKIRLSVIDKKIHLTFTFVDSFVKESVKGVDEIMYQHGFEEFEIDFKDRDKKVTVSSKMKRNRTQKSGMIDVKV